MPDISYRIIPFSELDTDLLYAILRLRSEVFVVEQNCVYQDLDDNDQQALHLVGLDGGSLVCYARLFAPGVKYAGASIGRVITAPGARGSGLGRPLMEQAIGYCDKTWPRAPITISAQQHLEQFYTSVGFQTVSAPYMEDDIPHIEMTRPGHA